MNKMFNKISAALAMMVLVLGISIIGTFTGTVLAVSEGEFCGTRGAVQDNLTCGSCTSRGCVWESTSKQSPLSLTKPQKNDSDAACQSTNNASGNPSIKKVQDCLVQSPIIKRINELVNFLSGGVAIVVTAVILVGGIQYILAGGNASAITAARHRITNGLIALFAFLFMFAFLQWLIPGGIFK
jgi:hypothetical protein